MKYLILFVCLILCQSTSLAQLSVSLPIPGVYQTTGTYTPIVLAGQYIGPSLANYRIEYKLQRLNVSNGTIHTPVTTYSSIVTNPQYGLYRLSMSLQVGWYQVDVRVFNITTGTPLSYTYTTKFGIGDVYVIAGQSNAQGYPASGTWSLPSISTYDGILSHNYNGSCNANFPPFPSMSALNGYNRIAPSGNNSWYWAKLGQKLQMQSGTPAGGKPIAFFNAAAGGSSIVNWSQSAAGYNTYHDYSGLFCAIGGYSGPPQPYFDFKTTLNYYGSIFGVKAVLWHQGEADNNAEKGRFTSRVTYRDSLDFVIDKSRTDFASKLRWLVSEASFNGKNDDASTPKPVTRTDITLAQNDVIIPNFDGTTSTIDDKSFKGVTVDNAGIGYRDVTDKVHFRQDRSNAMTYVSDRWYEKLTASNWYSNIGAATPPVVTMSKSGSNWTLTVAGSYSEYRWLNMWSPDPNTPVGTGFSLSGSSSFGAYACMVKNAAGNWTISQTIYTSCGSCRTDISETTEWVEQELGIEVKAYPLPFDKDVTIEFTIPNESMVKLDLVGPNGEVITKLSENTHAKGTYKYPVNNQILNSGISFYRLTVNGLAITKKLLKSN